MSHKKKNQANKYGVGRGGGGGVELQDVWEKARCQTQCTCSSLDSSVFGTGGSG